MEAETKNELKMRIRVDGRKEGERNCVREDSNFYSMNLLDCSSSN